MEQIQMVEMGGQQYGLVPKDKLYVKTPSDNMLSTCAFLCLIGYVTMKAIAGLTGVTLFFMLGFLGLMTVSLVLDLFAAFKKKED